MVYEILQSNDMCKYYEIDKNAGISLRGRKKEQYAWLDDPEVAEKLIVFSDGTVSKAVFYLPQIHCASCIWLVENLYRLSPGIRSSKVDFLKKEVSITYAHQSTNLRKVVELLDTVGYAPSINMGTLAADRKPVSRRLIYQIGVAGFAFGNIMLLSFPEYFGLGESEGFFRNLFGYINIFLATPVAFYSGKDYLTAAWYSLRTRNFGIDIPLALGILVLYFRSLIEIVTMTGAGYMDSLAGLVFFLLIGKWFQQTTFHSISFDRDYRSYFPVAVTRLNTNAVEGTASATKEEVVSIDKLEAGDTILIHHKELIPADGLIKRGNALIDYSFVTGEAEPVAKKPGEKVYAGGRQVGDSMEVLMTRKVSQSYLTQLWNDTAFESDKLAGASQLANSVSRYFTAIILIVAFGALIYWLPKDKTIAFQAFTAVLIVACPCAAALNVPFTLGNAVRILGKRGFFLKNTNVIEALEKITAVVFDKTGTLTLASGNELAYVGEKLSLEDEHNLGLLAKQSTHPVSRQVAAHYPTNSSMAEITDFQAFTGAGVVGSVNGKTYKLGSKLFVMGNLDSQVLPNGKTAASAYLSIDGNLTGQFYLRNNYRSGALEMVRFFGLSKKIFLLSGDHEQERPVLEPYFGTAPASMLFNQTPQDKLNFVKNQQVTGEKLLMLGDGLNDAGALKQSDVGIVIAEDTNNFTPACDAILDAKKFNQLPDYLRFAHKSIHTVYGAWILAAIYNIIGLTFAVQGLLSPLVAAVLMPLSSVSIVAVGVGISTLAARKLG